MPLKRYLSQLSSNEALELVVDKARSPACPTSISHASRRKSSIKSCSKNRKHSAPKAVDSRWQPEEGRASNKQLRHQCHRPRSDVALKIPSRAQVDNDGGSSDDDDCTVAMTSIHAASANLSFKACRDPPTMPQRLTTPVPRRRVLRRRDIV